MDFINKVCECCGEPDLVLSELHLVCNYGSKYDGENLRLAVCGKCMDKFYEHIVKEQRRAEASE